MADYLAGARLQGNRAGDVIRAMPIRGVRYAFTDGNVNEAPDQAGVYALYDGDAVIYYGRAMGGTVTIRSRLKDHKAGREGPCTKDASHFNWEVTVAPVKREEELLDEHRRTRGRLPRCNERIG